MKNVIYSRAHLYSDGSGIETSVSFDPTYRLCEPDQQYVEIRGVGDPVHVRVDHINDLVVWLLEIQKLAQRLPS